MDAAPADRDLADEHVQPSASEGRIRITKPPADARRKAADHGRRQFSLGTATLTQGGKIGSPFPNLQLGEINALLERGIVYFGDASLDGIIETVKPCLGFAGRDTLTIDLGFELQARGYVAPRGFDAGNAHWTGV